MAAHQGGHCLLVVLSSGESRELALTEAVNHTAGHGNKLT